MIANLQDCQATIARMVADYAARCEYGCCRGTGPSGRDVERRTIKRGERNRWRDAVRHDFGVAA